MTLTSRQVSVTNVATELTDGTAAALRQAYAIDVINTGSATVYIGASGVTTSTGRAVPAGASFQYDLQYGEKLYGITASATCVCGVLQSKF